MPPLCGIMGRLFVYNEGIHCNVCEVNFGVVTETLFPPKGLSRGLQICSMNLFRQVIQARGYQITPNLHVAVTCLSYAVDSLTHVDVPPNLNHCTIVRIILYIDRFVSQTINTL